MPTLTNGRKTYAVDELGFLLDFQQWSFALAATLWSGTATAQQVPANPFAPGEPLAPWERTPQPWSPSRFRLGIGAGTGPGTFQGIYAWWNQGFVAFAVPMSAAWELRFEPSVMWTSSEYTAGRSSYGEAPSEGVVRVDGDLKSNAQEFEGTLVLLRVLAGYRFGRVFALQGGPFIGRSESTTRTTVCGEDESRSFAYGGSVIPTISVGSGFELGVQLDVGHAPVSMCIGKEPGQPFDFVHWQDEYGAATFRLAFMPP